MTDGGGVGFEIGSIWAYVAVHADGDEGIAGFSTPNGMIPMIAADPVRLEQLQPMAQKIATQTGLPIKLVMFSGRTDLETIEP